MKFAAGNGTHTNQWQWLLFFTEAYNDFLLQLVHAFYIYRTMILSRPDQVTIYLGMHRVSMKDEVWVFILPPHSWTPLSGKPFGVLPSYLDHYSLSACYLFKKNQPGINDTSSFMAT